MAGDDDWVVRAASWELTLGDFYDGLRLITSEEYFLPHQRTDIDTQLLEGQLSSSIMLHILAVEAKALGMDVSERDAEQILMEDLAAFPDVLNFLGKSRTEALEDVRKELQAQLLWTELHDRARPGAEAVLKQADTVVEPILFYVRGRDKNTVDTLLIRDDQPDFIQGALVNSSPGDSILLEGQHSLENGVFEIVERERLSDKEVLDWLKAELHETNLNNELRRLLAKYGVRINPRYAKLDSDGVTIRITNTLEEILTRRMNRFRKAA